jgi:predicted membrane metal-binding protein
VNLGEIISLSKNSLVLSQGGVCLAFADQVLCWLYGTVKESKFFIHGLNAIIHFFTTYSFKLFVPETVYNLSMQGKNCQVETYMKIKN